jgi:hypothetical protein
MVAKSFLKHKIPFQYTIRTGKPERVNIMTLKAADQRFRLGYKPIKRIIDELLV